MQYCASTVVSGLAHNQKDEGADTKQQIWIELLKILMKEREIDFISK